LNPVIGAPALSIEVQSDPLSGQNLLALGEVRIEHRLSLPSQCELSFFDPHPAWVESALAWHGRALRVAVSPFPTPLFKGEITAVEHSYEASHGSVLRLRGYDLLHRLRKRQPVRVHIQTTVVELAVELTKDLGLVVKSENAGPLLKRSLQHRHSDLEVLSGALEACGLYTTLRGDVLHIISLMGIGAAETLTLGKDLLEAHFSVNGDSACRSVSVAAWDPSRVESRAGRAVSPRSGRTASAKVSPELFASTGEQQLTGEFFNDDRQAEALAQAELDRRIAREVTVRGTAEGNPKLLPGALVDISGVASSLTGNYVVTAVTHRIERSTGFISEFSTAVPPATPRSPRASIALGIVTGVNDPDGLGRIRVSLPAQGDLETEWLSVVSPGAGRDKGFTVLPNTGDQVLVLFTGDTGSFGVVLGGLYGSANPPDAVADAGAITRYSLVTSGRQKLTFDDTARSIRFENATGSYFELSPESLMLHSTSPLTIEAIGQPVYIRGKAIHFEET
jgi:phage baseplate assembly protein gpV